MVYMKKYIAKNSENIWREVVEFDNNSCQNPVSYSFVFGSQITVIVPLEFDSLGTTQRPMGMGIPVFLMVTFLNEK